MASIASARYFRMTEKLRVGQATEELRANEADDERRGKLVDYVDSAFAHIRSSCDEASDDLGVISKQARQVEAILADQERHTKAAPVAENLTLNEVLDEAVACVAGRRRRRRTACDR